MIIVIALGAFHGYQFFKNYKKALSKEKKDKSDIEKLEQESFNGTELDHKEKHKEFNCLNCSWCKKEKYLN